MQNFKVLDCTLRDGGYYNNWYFSTSFTKNYLSTLAKTSVDIIEIGFRKPINSTSIRLKKVGAFLYSDEKYLSKLNLPKKKQISVMIDLTDYSENKGFIKLKKNFGESKNSVISMVRIACNYNDKKKVNKVVRYLKKKKYIVCVNLMKFTILENKQILSFFEFALKSGADFLYLADSFGNCLPSQIKNISKFLKKKIDIRRVGFHSHDNMGNALKNSIAAINEGFGIIDTSLMGMGRGAGNLKLEDFLYYKKRILEKRKIDIFSQDYLHPLKKKYQWGKNQYYNYSAKNNIHPTFVQRFLEEKKFDKKQILKMLQFLKKNKATQYDMNIFDNLFLNVSNYKIKKVNYLKKIAIICDNPLNKKLNLEKIKRHGFMTSSLNYINFIDSNSLDLIFMCNAYRVFTEIDKAIKLRKTNLIIPNYYMLKKLLKNNSDKIINYNIFKNENLIIEKNLCMFQKNLALIYALSFCISKNFDEIAIFGLTKNDSNLKILKQVNHYIKKKKYKSKITLS